MFTASSQCFCHLMSSSWVFFFTERIMSWLFFFSHHCVRQRPRLVFRDLKEKLPHLFLSRPVSRRVVFSFTCSTALLSPVLFVDTSPVLKHQLWIIVVFISVNIDKSAPNLAWEPRVFVDAVMFSGPSKFPRKTGTSACWSAMAAAAAITRHARLWRCVRQNHRSGQSRRRAGSSMKRWLTFTRGDGLVLPNARAHIQNLTL